MTIFKVGDVVRMKPRIANPVEGPGGYRMVYNAMVGKDIVINSVHRWPGDHNWNYDDSWIKLKKSISFNTLYNKAKEYKIVGRSKLTKEGLKLAVDAWEQYHANELEAIKAAKALEEKKEKERLEAIELAKELETPLGEVLRKKVGSMYGTCHWAREHADGVRTYHNRAVCHRNLIHPASKSDTTAMVFDIASHYDNHPDKEEYKQWVEWMIVNSPWAKCFITKDWNEALNGGVYANVDESFNRVSCAAVALRQGSEFPTRVKTWKVFIDLGYSGSVSWLMANIVVYYTKTLSFAKIGISGGHDIFTFAMNLNELVKFFNEGFHIGDGVSVRKHTGGIYYIWDSIAISSQPSLKDFVSTLIKVEIDGWSGSANCAKKDVIACADELKKLITT